MPIPDYEPEFFSGVEKPIEMNPACQSFKEVDEEFVTLAKDDLETIQAQFEESSSFDSTSEDSNCLNITTSLDMISLDTTCLSTIDTFTINSNQVTSAKPTRKSLFAPWTCKVCYIKIPCGQTWEQAMHEKKHGDQPKD